MWLVKQSKYVINLIIVLITTDQLFLQDLYTGTFKISILTQHYRKTIIILMSSVFFAVTRHGG